MLIPEGSETAWKALYTHKIIRARTGDMRFNDLVTAGLAWLRPVGNSGKTDFIILGHRP